MSDPSRPWWSSGPAAEPKVEPGPGVEERQRREQERAAREQAAGARANGGPGAATDGNGQAPGADGEHVHHDHAAAPGDVCSVCPICTALRLVGEVRPDLLVHLTEAARHLTLAAKAIIDVQAGGFGSRGLEHIPLDDDA